MYKDEKPRIGFLGIMQELYDDMLPGITERQEMYAQQVIDRLGDIADFYFPGAAKNRNDIERIVKEFNDKDLDGIMIVMLTYGPATNLVNALRNNRLPIMLANIQPESTVTDDWDMGDLTYNQGVHGAQDTSNIILRMGITCPIITEDWHSEEFKDFVNDWAKTVKTVKALRNMKIAQFGRMHGMYDIMGDDAAFTRKIGPQINQEYIGQVFRYMEEATNEEIDKVIEENKKNFYIDPKLSEESHRYAARLQIGFKKLLVDKGYAGFSAHFDVFKGDGRFKQIHMMAASNLMAEGYGYAAEGDVVTASLVAAGHVLVGDAHFTEMYAMDFKKDSILMSHMGEGNWKIARKDRPIKLVDRELGIGKLDNPPTVVFMAQPGVATLASLVSLEGERYRLVVSKGEILDTEEAKNIEMPYFHFKPENGVRACLNGWLKNGGTHHQCLTLGDTTMRWKLLCELLDIEYVEV
uniref:L-arabinose isomerase n=1 Tax=Thermoanaerobacterium saccharolyticum TaxID=28896 RepID=K7SW59_THESA|nr:L-arabinose isomerase [Thermoanaerobacterium saccharolyticum]